MDRQKDAAWCIARQGKGSRCVSVGLGCVARWVWRGQGQGLWGVVPMSVGPSECRGSPAGWGGGLLTVGAGGQACAVFAPWPGGGCSVQAERSSGRAWPGLLARAPSIRDKCPWHKDQGRLLRGKQLSLCFPILSGAVFTMVVHT